MKCHDVQRMISGFIEKKLTDEQLEGFLEHIENCQDCYDELEVYYMITIGLMQLDEDHTGTMDLKKNLKDFISEQNKELYMRKRLAARRHFAKRAGIVIMAVILAFCSHTLLFSEQEIHTLNDFKDAAAVSLYAFWFGEDAVTEDMGNISETSDVSSGRLYFEQHYPVILPAGFSVEQRGLPDGGNMIEKELIVK